MADPTACAFCEDHFKSSDWSPFCSAGCEALASLAMERTKGAEAERAAIAAWLQAHSDGAPSGLWDAYALSLMAARIRAGNACEASAVACLEQG